MDPLDRELREQAARLGITFKDALNRVIAAGLGSLEHPPPAYKVRAKACGIKPGIDWLHLNRLADELEDEKRTTR